MEKTFEYLETKVFVEQLNLKDIGNCIIEGKTEFSTFYYLTIQTELGFTRVCEFGPCTDCLQYDVKCFNFKHYKMDYSDNKCASAIGKFLNNPSYTIVEAKEINFEDLTKNCDINILGFVKGNY